MADVHIDPDFPTNGVGTEEDPHNTWPTLVSDNNYYQKRGTVFTTTTIMQAFTTSNILIDAYGEGDLPIIETYRETSITGDWAEVATDIWKYDLGTEYFNRPYLLGLGELGTDTNPSWTERVNYRGGGSGTSGAGAFTEHGQWDSDPGAVGVPSALYVYADQNPVTKWGPIYYVLAQHPTFAARNAATSLTIQNIHFRRGYTALQNQRGAGDTDDIILQDCIIEHEWFGMMFGGTSGDCVNSIARRNLIYRSGGVGIRLQDDVGTNCYILNNEVYRTGIAEGIGGIYGSPSVATGEKLLEIGFNIIDGVALSPYWVNEGRCLYIETASSNILAYGNYCTNAYTDQAGIHLNGGSDNVFFVGNHVNNCNKGFASSDSAPAQTDDFYIYNNIFSNVATGIRFTRPSALGTMSAHVRNNVCVSDGSTGNGIFINPDVAALGGVDEDYNYYYNFSTTATNITIGSNSSEQDPKLTANGIPLQNSPLYHAGEVVSFGYKDRRGHLFNVPPTIGAYEFTSGSVAQPRKPSGYASTHDLTIGLLSVFRGFISSVGSISPNDYYMREITSIAVSLSTDILTLVFNSVIYLRVKKINITIDGYGDVEVNFNGSSYISSANAALSTFFDSNVGNTISITIAEDNPAFIPRTAASARLPAVTRQQRD